MHICRTFGCLPSQAMDEDADIIRLMKIDMLASQGGEEWQTS